MTKRFLHAMAGHPQVMQLLESMRATDGCEVNYDKDAGTIKATFDGVVVYSAIQKGDVHQPWIGSYSTEFFKVKESRDATTIHDETA